MLAGVLPAGSLDPTFGQGGLVTPDFGHGGYGGVAALQPDGKIVAAEEVDSSGTATIGLARFLPDGRPDTGFGGAGTGEVVLDSSLKFNDPDAIAVVDDPGQSDDGKIVVGGTWTDSSSRPSGVALARFNVDGSVDASFGHSGAILDARTTGGASALAIQPDGKVLVVGMNLVSPTAPTGFVERYNTDGTPDTGFADQGVTSNPSNWIAQGLSAIVLDPNGGLFVAGFTPDLAGFAVAHLTAGGQLDSSFGRGGFATDGVGGGLYGVTGLAIDPSLGLVVVGDTPPGSASPAAGDSAVVTRFTLQGSVDASFNQGAVEFIGFQPPSTGVDETARAVAVQPDGKVLVAGATGLPGSSIEAALVRLNPDGTRDTGFGSGGVVLTQFPGPFSLFGPGSLLLQPDGKIVVSGQSGDSLGLARYFGSSGSTTLTPQPPLVGPINAPSPVLVGVNITAGASFSYNIPTDRHTAVWNWGDGKTSTGDITEANGQGSVSGSHVYAVPGLYQITVTVTDQRGASGSATAVPGVVVISLFAGPITGTGVLNGPPFMVAAAVSAGQVRFRLAARYAGNRTVPQGQTVLQFKAMHRTFRSTGLDWLVVSGGNAWYEGTGTIDGAGSYGFLVSASGGGSGAGKVRIRIWDEATGAVVYDSQPGAPIDAAPATPIARGHIALRAKHAHERSR